MPWLSFSSPERAKLPPRRFFCCRGRWRQPGSIAYGVDQFGLPVARMFLLQGDQHMSSRAESCQLLNGVQPFASAAAAEPLMSFNSIRAQPRGYYPSLWAGSVK